MQKTMRASALLLGLIMLITGVAQSWKYASQASQFRVLALAEPGGHHIAYTKAAKVWLDQLAADSNFLVDYIENTDKINEDFLKQYKLFIQLDYPPYAWKPEAAKAFEKAISDGVIGWIGFHHATLLGEFDDYPLWQWFSDFMGGIRFTDYIAEFAAGNVKVEDRQHPVMKGLPAEFVIEKEEWYTYNKSPRANVKVLASVDESSYTPGSDKKMGDHPVIWTNPKMPGKNIYIFMGHSPALFENENYKALFRNAISWASKP